MDKHYQCSSVFAPYINQFISQRRAHGYSYVNTEYYLKRFDAYCLKNHIKDPLITRELFEGWIENGARSREGKKSRYQRETILRTFSIYMNILEMESYVPHQLCRPPKVLPYLMSDRDVQEFFAVLDEGRCRNNYHAHSRMYTEYRVMFRMICCCGLRNSEACGLSVENIDLEKGIITIIHSKGDKDRLVYMADDLTQICRSYWQWLISDCGIQSKWFFPSVDTGKHIIKHSDAYANVYISERAKSKTGCRPETQQSFLLQHEGRD